MANTGSKPERVYALDWLRIFAVLLLVPFHTAMLFVEWGFHIKNPDTSLGLTVFNGFLNNWHMPLLFLLSGAGTWFALAFRSPREYVKERFLRLFVPLIFGMLMIIPPQIYVERLYKGQFHGSYFAFYKQMFNGFYPDGDMSWHHLWFLLYLFFYSLVLLPLFVWLRSERGRDVLQKTAAYFGRGVRIYLLFIPLAVAAATLWVVFTGMQTFIGDWGRLSFMIICFFYGGLVCTNPAYRATATALRWLSFACGLVFVLVLAYIQLGPAPPAWGLNPYNMAMCAISSASAWFWVLAFVGLSFRRLNFPSRFLKYGNEAVLPFYILHQTFILVLGYYVIQLPWGIMPKFLVIMTGTFVGTILVYDLVVKRIAPLRFLFGMRPRR